MFKLGVATCNHRDFSPELIATIRGAELTLSANELRLFATGLQSSAPAHNSCDYPDGGGRVRLSVKSPF